MSSRAARSLPLLLAASLYATSAHAEVQFVAPADWSEGANVDPSASSRAQRWADDLGGITVQVFASTARDDFVETLALISIAEAVPADLSDEASQRAWMDAKMKSITGGASAVSIERVSDANVPAGYLHARYDLSGVLLDVSAIADGASTNVVILASRAGESVIYDPLFDQVRASFRGGSEPLHPYDVAAFRRSNFIGWGLGLIAAFVGGVFVFSERKGDHARVGRLVAMGLIGAALVVALAVFLSLGGEETTLAAAGSSRGGLAGEVFGVGAAAALIAMVLGRFLERDQGPIQSAPQQLESLSQRLSAADAERDPQA